MIDTKNPKFMLLKFMNDFLINHVNDEDYYLEWITYGPPDESDDNDIYDCSQNKETMEWCVNFFNRWYHKEIES